MVYKSIRSVSKAVRDIVSMSDRENFRQEVLGLMQVQHIVLCPQLSYGNNTFIGGFCLLQRSKGFASQRDPKYLIQSFIILL